MDEKKLNDNEKTMVFNPIKEKNKKETPISEEKNVDFIEELVDEDYDEDEYEDDDYEDDEISNRTKIILIVATALATIIFVAVCVWGISTLVNKRKEKPEIPEKEDIVVEEPEKIEEAPVEEPVEEKENIVYNIAFLPGSVEQEGDSYTIRAKLYNKSMVSEGEKRIVLNDSTEIVEDGEELSLVSFISIIESIEDEEIIFKGKISEKTREVINISYRSEILEVLQESEPEPEIEENTGEEITEEDIPLEEAENSPTEENKGEAIE